MSVRPTLQYISKDIERKLGIRFLHYKLLDGINFGTGPENQTVLYWFPHNVLIVQNIGASHIVVLITMYNFDPSSFRCS